MTDEFRAEHEYLFARWILANCVGFATNSSPLWSSIIIGRVLALTFEFSLYPRQPWFVFYLIRQIRGVWRGWRGEPIKQPLSARDWYVWWRVWSHCLGPSRSRFCRQFARFITGLRLRRAGAASLACFWSKFGLLSPCCRPPPPRHKYTSMQPKI